MSENETITGNTISVNFDTAYVFDMDAGYLVDGNKVLSAFINTGAGNEIEQQAIIGSIFVLEIPRGTNNKTNRPTSVYCYTRSLPGMTGFQVRVTFEHPIDRNPPTLNDVYCRMVVSQNTAQNYQVLQIPD